MAPRPPRQPSPSAANAPPPLSALFLINFDVKAGYTIVWKRTEPGVQLDDLVEYKSLPSGLHTVKDDLVYFVHESAHAGLSAFVNEPCEEEDLRNARMIAVGVLVPLSFGRLGRSWRHADALKEMAAKLAKNPHQTEILEKYWQSFNALQAGGRNYSPVPSLPSSPLQGRKTSFRRRSVSDANALVPPEHKLSPFHPAWSLAALLDKFGPLIFPIHRAALLRRRILISGHAPVHQMCDFVYDISVLSNIPIALLDDLPPSPASQRLRPLFNIGVHDIPFLIEDQKASQSSDSMDDESKAGWVACTTDSILAMKDTLWDMLITMPPDHSVDAREKVWPVVECPKGNPIKATQRDLRRFNALRLGLAQLIASAGTAPDALQPESPGIPPRASSSSSRALVQPEGEDSVDKIIEPQTWASLAYSGFMWWASAGEQLRSEEQEETSRDAALLADLDISGAGGAPHSPMTTRSPSTSRIDELLTDSIASLVGNRDGSNDGDAHVELAIIAYFHRLTTQILSVLVDLVDNDETAYPQYTDDAADEQEPTTTDSAVDNDNDEEEDLLVPKLNTRDTDDSAATEADDAIAPITVDSRAVETMGLDIWSLSDAEFIRELMGRYFGRDAKLEGKGVEVCGVRVC